jgi:hypothetical protein
MPHGGRLQNKVILHESANFIAPSWYFYFAADCQAQDTSKEEREP